MPNRPTGHPALPGGLFCATGNPLSDGTWTYTWEKGRQLKQMQSVDTTASFIYNENGLRVQKTVNGVVTDYTLHGKNIVHMKKGNDELHFFYDASNKPAIVEYNGTKYAYVHNLQGDIVAIVDAEGNTVTNSYNSKGQLTSINAMGINAMTVTYDSKGNTTSTTDALGNDINYEYDSKGQLVKDIFVYNDRETVTTYSYDDNGKTD